MPKLFCLIPKEFLLVLAWSAFVFDWSVFIFDKERRIQCITKVILDEFKNQNYFTTLLVAFFQVTYNLALITKLFYCYSFTTSFRCNNRYLRVFL